MFWYHNSALLCYYSYKGCCTATEFPPIQLCLFLVPLSHPRACGPPNSRILSVHFFFRLRGISIHGPCPRPAGWERVLSPYTRDSTLRDVKGGVLDVGGHSIHRRLPPEVCYQGYGTLQDRCSEGSAEPLLEEFKQARTCAKARL